MRARAYRGTALEVPEVLLIRHKANSVRQTVRVDSDYHNGYHRKMYLGVTCTKIGNLVLLCTRQLAEEVGHG